MQKLVKETESLKTDNSDDETKRKKRSKGKLHESEASSLGRLNSKSGSLKIERNIVNEATEEKTKCDLKKDASIDETINPVNRIIIYL